jgi:hypothetical protein
LVTQSKLTVEGKAVGYTYAVVKSYSRYTQAKLVSSPKAFSPMYATLLGIVIEVRLDEPLKAWVPIEVTVLGIVIEAKLEHP